MGSLISSLAPNLKYIEKIGCSSFRSSKSSCLRHNVAKDIIGLLDSYHESEEAHPGKYDFPLTHILHSTENNH